VRAPFFNFRSVFEVLLFLVFRLRLAITNTSRTCYVLIINRYVSEFTLLGAPGSLNGSSFSLLGVVDNTRSTAIMRTSFLAMFRMSNRCGSSLPQTTFVILWTMLAYEFRNEISDLVNVWPKSLAEDGRFCNFP